MIRMATLPVGKNNHSRPGPPDYARNLQPVLPDILNTTVWNIERLAPRNAQDFRGLGSLALAIFSRSACSHLATREVENTGATAECGHLEQGSGAGLFNVVTMRGDRKDVEWQRGHYCVRLYPGPRKARPGRSSVILLSSTTGLPFTKTSFTPTE